jgi:uncharacterized FlgJ-related protein
MGFWIWLRPDAKALIHLAGLYCGDPDAVATQAQEQDRRKAKAKALKELTAAWKETERKIVYLLSDPADIKLLMPTVTKSLAAIESETEWLANGNYQ